MSINFIEIETVEPNFNRAVETELHNKLMQADIELTKDCEACMEFPVFQHYCVKHQCPFCSTGFKVEWSAGCEDCIPF